MYAWYSAAMENFECGFCVYRRPDGRCVNVSVVSHTREHGCGWEDMKYLGKVVGALFGGLVSPSKARLPMMTLEPPRYEGYARVLWPHGIMTVS